MHRYRLDVFINNPFGASSSADNAAPAQNQAVTPTSAPSGNGGVGASSGGLDSGPALLIKPKIVVITLLIFSFIGMAYVTFEASQLHRKQRDSRPLIFPMHQTLVM